MDTDLAPKSPSEAAIIRTLPANNTAYSAIVRGVNGTGIGLAEVYDLDKGPGSQLLNLSSRGFVQTQDNVMIGGLIIAGSGSTKYCFAASGRRYPPSALPIR